MSQSLFLGYSGLGFDTDAQAFIDAVGTLESSEETIIDDLVRGFKDNGTWDNYDAIYPFIGGTAAEHKWNLKDPRDLDAAFRLTFGGTVTHDANGITPSSGVADRADTHYIPKTSGNLTNTSANLGIYLHTIGGSITGSRAYMAAASSAGISGTYGLAMFSSGSRNIGMIGAGSGQYAPSGSSAEVLGLVQVTTNGDRNAQHWKNGVKNGSTLAMTDASALTRSLTIGVANSSSTGEFPTDRTFSFAFIGTGPTDTEVSDDYDLIQNYQTALSRDQ